MKTILFTLLMMSAALLFGLDTDTAKFFRREAGPETVELPADQIYPQGRLFPFTFYSTGGGSMKKRGELLPEAEREADTAQIVKAGVTMIGPQYELNDRAVATARKYGVKVVYTVHPVIDGKELDRPLLLKLAEEDPEHYLDRIREAMTKLIREQAKNPEIAWWDVSPEELRFWIKPEVEYIKLAYETIKANDPLKRPVFFYEPGHRGARGPGKIPAVLGSFGQRHLHQLFRASCRAGMGPSFHRAGIGRE